MRLTPDEVEAIRSTVLSFLGEKKAGMELLLFGSRSRPDLKGGDIDLALITPDEEECRRLRMIDYKIVTAIQSLPAIGEQKIDLKILTPSEKRSDPFFASALRGAVRLWP